MPRPLVALVIASTLSSGCSFLVMRSPVHYHTGRPVCRTTRAPAVYDAVSAAGSVLAGVAMTSPRDDDGPRLMVDPAFMMGIAVAQAVPYVVSSAYGFRKAAECDAALARWGGTEAPGSR